MSDIGDRLQAALRDRYEFLGLAGEGGMALVFRARETATDRQVAVKVFRPELSSSLTEARFLREIRIGDELDHENIVPVLDSGRVDDLLFFVMPFITGETLAERINREGPFDLTSALGIVREVAAGLAHAHSAGYIHRDVKPGNIMLGPNGAVITDFGVARALVTAGGDRLTLSGFSVGTPTYMSPEQGAGNKDIDARSDEYSLACVLFEMLVGEPPFTGPSAKAVVARHISETPPSPTVVRPGIPRAVELAIHRALAKDAADRFPDVSEFVAALTREAPPEHGPHRRRRILAVLLAGVLLSVIAVWQWPESPELDAERVLIFPPADEQGESGVSDPVATYIGYALEGTDPLRWEEARDWLDAGTDMATLSHRDRLRIARAASAAYFIDGSVIRAPDSLTVVLRLVDAHTGALIERSGESGPAGSSEAQLGAGAIRDLLAAIIEPGRPVDLGALSDRSPAAIANFYQGELAYRNTRFDEALDHYQAAIEADPLFAIAAAKGAQAAGWYEDPAAASAFAELAIQHDTLLPTKYRDFILGVRHYHGGRSDSAVAALSRTVTGFPEWAEGHTALAEVFYHLMPDAANLDSLARAEFQNAINLDSAFALPLYHLAEMAIRDGELETARFMIDRLELATPDRVIALQLQIMMACAESGPSSMAWEAWADTAARAVLSAAQAMSPADGLRPCTEAAAEASLRPGTREAFGAYLLLQGLLLADGRVDDMLRLAGSEQVRGLPVDHLHLLGATVDSRIAPIADSFYATLGTEYSQITSPNLWLMLQFATASGRSADVGAIAGEFELRGRSGGRVDTLFAGIAAVHRALAAGDDDHAFELLTRLRPTATVAELVWNPWEAVVWERLRRVELLAARDSIAAARRQLHDLSTHRSVAELLYAARSRALSVELDSR